MEKFKKRWEITQDWQLLFPLIGIIALAYTSYKISNAVISKFGVIAKVLLAVALFFILLRFTLFLFKKLENKWILDQKWEMIRVFIVFAITGSSSMFVGRPVIKLLGITKENLNVFIYWILFIIIGLVFYQILLVFFGFLFGQFRFFWEFEKKMLKRFGLGKFVN
ncbi:DUF6787 family protein [Winogradskyella haliclonae]|uniref:DUF6787 domain-containing protein n=1 Tax=Winogradskyella haliclonae TaxID=2048558 RepID=A0ABQ2BY28_9FLAO|nr:DUF6787 family protein [Winogradskyella haliclonae]GGI57385.1 hypothetical protein GCM10011444_16940 [Winogradskyella haliclonae]